MSYFEQDARAINEAAKGSDSVVIGAGLMTLLSIRQPFYSVPSALEDVAAGAGSRFLWGWKREGYRNLQDNASGLRDAANATRGQGSEGAKELVFTIMRTVQGMGIVKASFFAQLLIGEGACMDSHNIAALGMPARCFRADKVISDKKLRERIAYYTDTWAAHGTSGFWWDRWCDHVATLYPDKYYSGADVSRAHLACLAFKPYVPVSEAYNYDDAIEAFS